ncbi:MAG: NAD(P)H-binding protein [Solirubrobacteraceae bacterium]|nr:NAD(P)H-binding protein [Solirubrobacteraceae bacterium]
MHALVAGATGFIGATLVRRLLDDGARVRALVRDRGRTRGLPVDDPGLALHEGDVLRPQSLQGAGDGIDVAYYLVHSMGRGEGGDFEEREARSAAAFARTCAAAGVGRVVYLGGLGDTPGSKHLRSRGATARTLAEHGPPLTYFRAGMVVGPGSESYRTLRHLVARLPVMIAPRWLSTATQPIDVDDVVAYLAAALEVERSTGREVQIGSPDVLSYGEMLDRMAIALGRRRRPKIPVPLLTPRLSSLWIGLVTPVDARVARPLIEGLSTETIVTDPSGASLFDITPIGFDESLRKAVRAERDA